jgi:two-component system, OmpR family, phosphate regulon sensor histidine kinase PhoR
MKNRNLRIVIVLALFSVTGIITVQIFWFFKAFDLKEKQFNHSVYIGLQHTAEDLYDYLNLPVPLEGLVNQVSANYFVVPVNSEIPTELLELYLKKEFEKLNILDDFEYGIYDCNTKSMIYGNYISFKDKTTGNKRKSLPVWRNDSYYFGVLFPNKNNEIFSQMSNWIFFSFLLIIVCVFFVYSIFMILKQKKLSDIQNDFINNMTHEFKTPISTIQITCDLLEKPHINGIPENVTHYSNIIREEVTRLKGHVDSVLEVAVLEKGKVKYSFEVTDVKTCIESALKCFRILTESRNMELKTDMEDAALLINADKEHLINVIYNLIDNAIKYCNNQPSIIISCSKMDHQIVLSVKDNGIGISSANQKKIFGRFYRVPTGNVHNVKGFGLGLFYVKSVIKSHKGRITVNSKLGEGTEFIIYFPEYRPV